MPENTGNPCKTDEELIRLIDELKSCKNKRSFKSWKNSFLARYESFVQKSGIDVAQTHYETFTKDLAKFTKSVNRVKSLEDTYRSGSLGVKGRNGLNELMKELNTFIEKLQKLAPKTGAEEKKMGYNKYLLGAVLIRDNFSVYELLLSASETLHEMKDDCLKEVADHQLLDQITYYGKNFKNFCDLMADLSLYEVMLACRKFSGDDDNILIFIDPKSGAIGELDKQKLVNSKLLTIKKEGTKVYQIEQATTGSDKDDLIKQVKVTLKI